MVDFKKMLLDQREKAMAAKLTLADVMGDQVTGKASSQAAPEKKAYRTKTGEYKASFGRTWRRLGKDDRESLSVLVRLSNAEGKFRGTTFVRLSWQPRMRANGDVDQPTRLFQQVVGVLGAPPSAELEKVISAIIELGSSEDPDFNVWGQEYFEVPVDDLTAEEGQYAREHGYTSSRVYINGENEAAAQRYVKKGYESKFDVQRISEL